MTNEIVRDDRGPVRVLMLNNPPVNGLSLAVRGALFRELGDAVDDDDVEAIVLAGNGKMFSAGADIREFGDEPPSGSITLPELIDAIEQSSKPVVAAIHGVAAGGGLELALGCHERVAAADARVGLPEVTLGIIPGAGGTQRLPRLIGVGPALDVILSGRLLPAPDAETLGILDAVVESAPIDSAVARARCLVGKSLRRASRLTARAEDSVFERATKSVAGKARGMEAPHAAIEAVRAAVELRERGFEKERELFLQLLSSDQSRAQRHLFFAEREAHKVPGVPKGTPIHRIESVGVVGCGTMGRGITICFADAGIPVVVVENDADTLDRGLEKIRGIYASSVAKGRASQADVDVRLGRIRGTTDFAELAQADLVIEAVFEDMAVKKDVFGRLDRVCKSDTILATNTSSLDVNEIASSTSRPERVVGMHFFSPAHVMKLVENVRGKRTSPETIATVMGLVKRLDKVGVVVGVCDGFVGNRMLYAYRRQADFLLEEGALPQQVDRALYDFGLPMGPFAMADLAGLDIGWAVRKRQGATRSRHRRYSPIADRICEMGRFGQKTGAGWYRYEKGSRTPIPDPEVARLIERVSEEAGIVRRPIADEEIVERCIYALINEGARILEEGIALRAGDIDVVWVYGYGFPRYRGGPMFHADLVGLDNVKRALTRLHTSPGDWMEPAPLLEKLASEGRRFSDWHR
ncbi:MAG TPA: 3-hydroxyacyl-CoA dehydrogenase NAD-binding domain-containing protein [Vicinamibacteria bacterium]|nr:3-hydroxyacyl-CoA dehydrogenase NAD-binding domain-containing protein [Vicinamibacteria bacterium]